jgi:hypothetical protein
MQTVTLQTQSFLFEGSDEQFRATPFYELSIEEWVVYENGQPKYLIDFNRRTQPLILDLTTKLDSGEPLEEVVIKIGRFLGRQWTTEHNIQGKEIPNTGQPESITLTLLDNLADLFMDVIFVAIDNIRFDTLLDEDKFINTYVTEIDELGIESTYAENQEDLIRMLTFIFSQPVGLTELASNGDKEIYDLTHYKHNCITHEMLEAKYENWTLLSNRENTMNEFGFLMGVISYIRKNIDKKHLVIITEKRKHWR